MRILVVEDEGLLALEAETFLERGGHTVVGIADTRTAALIRAGAAQPDLALVDLRLLDGNSGLDLAADLGALGVPVLFVTGNCPEKGGQGLALGCLHKPFDEGQLLAAVAVMGRLLQGEAVDPSTLPSNLHLYA
ncbi:response regulator [Roseicella aquatilis]|uniref:Response regulator n=1 Tax=Roseicella aquatilis TaxID=2527868 RepID=A0A4R4DRU6_9PROT|nr:response regulator [Roseicella aquatilis]